LFSTRRPRPRAVGEVPVAHVVRGRREAVHDLHHAAALCGPHSSRSCSLSGGSSHRSRTPLPRWQRGGRRCPSRRARLLSASVTASSSRSRPQCRDRRPAAARRDESHDPPGGRDCCPAPRGRRARMPSRSAWKNRKVTGRSPAASVPNRDRLERVAEPSAAAARAGWKRQIHGHSTASRSASPASRRFRSLNRGAKRLGDTSRTRNLSLHAGRCGSGRRCRCAKLALFGSSPKSPPYLSSRSRSRLPYGAPELNPQMKPPCSASWRRSA
jgi:hypothetical protein